MIIIDGFNDILFHLGNVRTTNNGEATEGVGEERHK
jgi:hypothetical protein